MANSVTAVPEASDDCVLFCTYDTDCGHLIGEMVLNAPKSLNALSTKMCQMMTTQLKQWQDDDRVVAVLLRGAGDKAFCAGGDIRKLYASMVAGEPAPNSYATEFFCNEYILDLTLHYYPKPVILWGTGIVMGGGMGLLSNCSHRVVTETTRFAMPEITIGLFPDATATWALQRMPAKMGLFFGLTGAQGNANDALLANLAEYVMPSDAYEQVLTALMGTDWRHSDLQATASLCLSKLSRSLLQRQDNASSGISSMLDKPSNIAKHWHSIHRLMNCGGLADIDAILRDDTKLERFDAALAHVDWVQRAVATYRHGCPVTAALTYQIYQMSGALSLEQVMYLETSIAVNCTSRPDFQEGVRALLIDKDKNPTWSHTMEECLAAEGQAYVASHFVSPYPAGEHPFDKQLGDDSVIAGYLRALS